MLSPRADHVLSKLMEPTTVAGHLSGECEALTHHRRIGWQFSQRMEPHNVQAYQRPSKHA